MDTLAQLRFLSSRFFTLPKGSKRPTFLNWQNTAIPFEKLQADGKNVATVCGMDLIILDVEGPKKTGSADGTQKLSALEEGLGRLPMAPTYHTPSGGMGIIFRNPGRVVPKCDLGKTYGIEMRTGNHFCILPPSSYEGETYGGTYEWEVTPEDVVTSEGEIPTLPESWIAWFLEMTCKEPLVFDGEPQSTPEHYDDTVKTWLWDVSAEIPYPEWWQVLAIIYRMSDKQEALALALEWSQTNGGEKWRAGTTEMQIRRLWRDMPKREAERQGEPLVGLSRLLTLSELYPMRAPEPPPTPVTPLPIMSIITSEVSERRSVADIMSKSQGIVRELYEHVSSISREVPAFRAAAALSVVAGVIQRTRIWPTGEAPNLLAFLVGPSSTTKSFFLEFAKAYLSEIDPNLLLPNVASDTGFHISMVDCPSRTYAEDEFGKRIEDAYINRNPKSRDNVNLVLKHYQPVNLLPIVRAQAAENRPPVPLATLSVMAVSTLQTMQKLFSVNMFKTDGLASRFAYFVHPESLPLSAESKPKWEPKPAIVQALRRLFKAAETPLQVTDEKNVITYELSKRGKFGDGSLIKEFKAQWVQELQAEELHMDADELEEIAAMRSRHLALVDKYALIHAVGCSRNDVEPADAEFALAMAKWHWETMKSDVLEVQTHEDKLREKIFAVLEKGSKLTGMTVRDIRAAGGRKGSLLRMAGADQIMKILEHLEADGLVVREGSKARSGAIRFRRRPESAAR